jgi:formylglycine-generating enzyme required for sulfatase activity
MNAAPERAPRLMIAFPEARVTLGLTSDEANRLALELAKVEEQQRDAGARGFDTFDLEACQAARRLSLAASMPAHEVKIGAYAIDRYPVTNNDWLRYVAETGADAPGLLGPGEHFVTGISWLEARAYARHYGLDLPTEAEWEQAARSNRSLFPWGDSYLPLGDIAGPAHRPYNSQGRGAVRSAHDVHDMVSYFGEYCSDPFAPYPGADEGLWRLLFPNTVGQLVQRGGYDLRQDGTCVSRRPVPADERRNHMKFRCVRHTIS